MAYEVHSYYTPKHLADRLKSGERVMGVDIELYGVADLGPDNRERVDANDPHALIAIAIHLGDSG